MDGGGEVGQGWEPWGHCRYASLRHALSIAAVRLQLQTCARCYSLNDGEGVG